MNLKSITAQSVVALSLVSVCSMSQGGFLDDLFSSSTKEPVALSTTTQEIMKNHPVWVIDGKDTSAWSVVEGKKPRLTGSSCFAEARGDLGRFGSNSCRLQCNQNRKDLSFLSDQRRLRKEWHRSP